MSFRGCDPADLGELAEPGPLASLTLSEFWTLAPSECSKVENEEDLPPDVAAMVTVCRPMMHPATLRLVNISPTSLRVTYPTRSVSYEYPGPHETPDPLT